MENRTNKSEDDHDLFIYPKTCVYLFKDKVKVFTILAFSSFVISMNKLEVFISLKINNQKENRTS